MTNAKAVPKARQKRLTRLQVMLSESELTALDNFRFQKRMPSRAAAIREILQRGLKVNGFAVADQGRASSDFGVLDDDGETAAALSLSGGGGEGTG